MAVFDAGRHTTPPRIEMVAQAGTPRWVSTPRCRSARPGWNIFKIPPTRCLSTRMQPQHLHAASAPAHSLSTCTQPQHLHIASAPAHVRKGR
eukprot:1158548-Pelagomonas_calceolata.AAC.4